MDQGLPLNLNIATFSNAQFGKAEESLKLRIFFVTGSSIWGGQFFSLAKKCIIGGLLIF